MFVFKNINLGERKEVVNQFKLLINSNPKSDKPDKTTTNSTHQEFNEGIELPTIVNGTNEQLKAKVYSALCAALVNGDTEEIRAWLEADGDPFQIIPPPYAPNIFLSEHEYSLAYGRLIHIAAYFGRDEIIRLLVNKSGSFISFEQLGGEMRGTTPLYAAAVAGHVTTVKLLVEEFQADTNAIQGNGNSKGDTALIGAVFEGQSKVVEYLIGKQADIHQCPQSGDLAGLSPLFIAVRNSQEEVVNLLVQNGADVNMAVSGEALGRTPLYAAAREGNVNIARCLINRGVNVNFRLTTGVSKGKTSLHAAVKYGNSAMVNLLAEHQADVFDPMLDSIFADKDNQEARDTLRGIKETISAMVLRIKNIKTGQMSPADSRDWLKKHHDDFLRSVMVKVWGDIVKVSKSIKHICARLAKTDLSENALREALKSFNTTESTATENVGPPILHLAIRSLGGNNPVATNDTAAPGVSKVDSASAVLRSKTLQL